MNVWFSLAFGVLVGALVVVEVVGVQRKKRGDTITENWRMVDGWLGKRFPWGQWLLRVFTAGMLTWTLMHFAGRW
jgi:hypothetical protein